MTSTSVARRPFNVLRLTVFSGLAAFAVVGCDPQGGGIASSHDASVESGGGSGSGGAGSGGAVTGGTSGSGGRVGSGGAGSGGVAGIGGSSASGGTTRTGGGSGGKPGTGGAANGGTVGLGGVVGSGGTSASGGLSATGGKVGSGGGVGNSAGTGGVQVSGGATARGGADGGANGGASGTGGTTGSGGSASTGPCTPDFGTTPSNVSAWINESWNAQLGQNVKDRKDWLLDNAMLGKGQINLCVRWGATSAPTAAVKNGMAAAVEKWFNDWFKNLDGYGCFPYSHITAKVTGWAVKPGKESWVSDLDTSTIKVYTETDPGTDPPGEPQCASACSFFDNWTHKFPNCPGGEAFHTDYWLWLDDNLPGSGAAAVGGDWGLRMPVSNFVASMGQSNLVIEHEMGHGFGFQDYYDWTGSTPAGGSLMIVGSTSSQTPTVADQWLLRRTWKEMKTLRGW